MVAIGPWWNLTAEPVEIDAVALSGRSREATFVAEAKWARTVDAGAVRRTLERKAASLPRLGPNTRYGVAAREQVVGDADVLRITAADIFGA